VGGGASIKEGLALGLKDKIKDKFVIACNYAFMHFDNNTFLAFCDRDFYKPVPKENGTLDNPDIYEELKKLSLIIGIDDGQNIQEFQLPNTLFFKRSKEYRQKDCLENGFYNSELKLTGIFALSLASFLMNYEGTIYLLGFDWTRRQPETIDEKNYNGKSDLDIHYYEKEIIHRGTGLIGAYERHDADKYFKCFIEPNLKIYNVSLQSNIEIFEKIDYNKMFDLLSQKAINQNELRQDIKNLFKNSF